MRITLDISALVASGKLTPEDARRLTALASEQTGSLGVNIMLGFGMVAVVVGIMALVPTLVTATVLGLVCAGAGIGLILSAGPAWRILAQVGVTVGALLLGGVLLFVGEGWAPTPYLLAIGLGAAAIPARSGLLVALAVLAVTAGLGAATGYMHALYMLAVPRPALTVIVLSALTLVLYLVSLRVPPDYERLAISGARTAILLVNLAFLVGSLWGDTELNIPDTAFVIGWAVALLAFGIWGAFANRRWVVNVAAVVGALHFYTQWFEALGASALSVLGGGVLLLAFGFALYALNARLRREVPQPAAG
jgi:hypothetical protein